MFTKDQYEIFKYVYEKEEKRFSELINRGKIYLSIITIYLAVFTIKIEDIKITVDDNCLSTFFATLTGVFFIIALLSVVFSLGILKYEGICNIKRELLNFPKSGKPDQEVFEDRLADFAVSNDRNIKLNNQRATFLKIASYLIVAGVSSHLLTFYVYLWR